MTRVKNLLRLALMLCVSLGISLAYINSDYFETLKYEQNHYAALCFSTNLCLLTFAQIGLLTTWLGKTRIKRLWDNHYLDNIKHNAIVGLITSAILMVDAILLIFFKAGLFFMYVEIIATITACVSFIWGAKQQVFLLSLLDD